jgi:signal transduction histidine kinase
MSGEAHVRLPRKAEELLSIAERMSYLRLLRCGFAIVVVAVGALAPSVREVSFPALLGVTGTYVVLFLVFDTTRWMKRINPRPIIGGVLLIDGIYLAWVAYATGGLQSPLRFLIYVHVVAVTLIASSRTGLKIATWHSLLLFASLYAQGAGILSVKERLPSALPGGSRFELLSTLGVGALWAVAVATAWLSSANEREIRGQKVDLERLSDMTAEMESLTESSVIPDVLLGNVGEVFGFARGAVLAQDDGRLALLAHRGLGSPAEIPPGFDWVMERAWGDRRTQLVRRADAELDPRLADLFPGGRNLLVVPMFFERGDRLGVLLLEHGHTGATMKRWVVTMIDQFASHGALALHNAWLINAIQQKLEENRILEAELVAHNLALESRVQERTQKLSESLESLRVVDAQRRALLSRLVNAEEEERWRIANDTHDGPVQLLTAAGLQLEVVRKRLADAGQDPLLSQVNEAIAWVHGSVEGMRTLIFELRPTALDGEGLAAALREYLGGLDPGLTWSLKDTMHEEPPDDVRVILYRIAQEALVNVRKHAKANRVEVVLEQVDVGYLVRIQDNGVGFDPSSTRKPSRGHLGLSSMSERAEMAGGRCEIRSVPGGGTSVEIWLPAKARRLPAEQASREYAAPGAA